MNIDIRGAIISDNDQAVYDYFKIAATSPKKVSAVLEEAKIKQVNQLTVTINSGGGSVFAAAELYRPNLFRRGERGSCKALPVYRGEFQDRFPG